MDKIKDNPEDFVKAQQSMFVGTGIVEVIPILLLVFGFVKMDTTAPESGIFTPIGIIILFMVFAVVFIFMQIKIGVPEKIKAHVQMFGMIGISLSLAVPIASLVALFTML